MIAEYNCLSHTAMRNLMICFNQVFIKQIIVSGSNDLSYQETLNLIYNRDLSSHHTYNYTILYFKGQL
jgi:hypothetical protein